MDYMTNDGHLIEMDPPKSDSQILKEYYERLRKSKEGGSNDEQK